MPFMSFSQISGTIISKETARPLSDATVSILRDNNTVGSKTFAAEDGTFMMLLPPAGNYQLSVSFIGYKVFTCHISVSPELKKLTIPRIEMERLPVHLSQVEVKASKPLLAIRKDTLEFSASDFYTAENATLKNLLEKIPGLYVDQEGNIFFQGTQIKDFYLDGRPILQASLSGMQQKKITQELLAGIADKIQIIDSHLPGTTSSAGSQGKILNVTVRKEMKTGISGSIGAGYGTKGRYNAAGNASMLRDNKQVLFSTGSNNLNSLRSPFSTDEGTYMMDGLGGIMKMTNFNSSISFDINKKMSISATILHQSGVLVNDNSSQRDNFLPDSSFQYNAWQKKRTHLMGDNIMTSMDFQATENDRLSIGFNGMYMNMEELSSGNYQSLTQNQDTINFGNNANSEDQKVKTFNITGNYAHKFKTPGPELSFSWNIGQNSTHELQHNYTMNFLGVHTPEDTTNQVINSELENYTANLTASFSTPIVKGLILTTGYNFTNNLTRNEQQAFDYSYDLHSYVLPDSGLTYRFRNINVVHVISTGLLYKKGKLEGSASATYTINNSNSTLFSSSGSYQQNISYFSPSLNFNYRFSNLKSLGLRLSNNVGMFDRTRSLIPVVSAKNPLYVQLGNPNLKPSVDHQATVEFRSMSLSGFNFSMTLNGVSQSNGVSTLTYADSIGRQISQPINVDGNYNLYAIVNLAKRFNNSGISLDYNIFSYLRHSNNYLNSIENSTTNYMTEHRLSMSWMLKKVAELTLNGNVRYFGSSYSLQKGNYMDFMIYKAYLGISTFLPLNLSIGSALIYNQNTSQQQQYTLMNAWISKTFLKSKSLQLKLYGYDLLKQNKALLSFQTATFTEQSQNSVVDQYYLLSVSYFFGKK